MIIVIMGVAGSGKTEVGKALAGDLEWSFLDADDFHPRANIEKMRAGVPLSGADREAWLASLRTLLRQLTARGTNAVLACSALRERFRERLREAAGELHFAYLKGDQSLFARRLEERTGHFMKANMLDSQLAALEEPADALELDASERPEVVARHLKVALRIG